LGSRYRHQPGVGTLSSFGRLQLEINVVRNPWTRAWYDEDCNRLPTLCTVSARPHAYRPRRCL
jgi:hypothetical protein